MAKKEEGTVGMNGAYKPTATKVKGNDMASGIVTSTNLSKVVSYGEPRIPPRRSTGWGGKKLLEQKRKGGLGCRKLKIEIQPSLPSLIGGCTRRAKLCGRKSFGKRTITIEGSMLEIRTDYHAPRSGQP